MRPIATLLLLVTLLTACAGQPPAVPTVAPTSAPATAAPATAAPATAVATVAPTPTTPFVAPPADGADFDGDDFDGARALAHVADQLALGPRYPGAPGHVAVRDYIVDTLAANGYAIERQAFTYQGFAAENIIGRINPGRGPIVILGAHYDTRRVSDQSPTPATPVPGAVDGASGVAVLLELARVLATDTVDHEIWLAFFDVEDNGSGGIDGWNWIAGSTYMADNLADPGAFRAMVLVDMIGDADQQLYYEGNSDPVLRAELWALADELGFGDVFIPQLKYTMIDDHVPFRLRGIPAVDIIDFDYPYWHTVEDTLDKVGADSLYRVGRVIEVWLEGAAARP